MMLLAFTSQIPGSDFNSSSEDTLISNLSDEDTISEEKFWQIIELSVGNMANPEDSNSSVD